MPGSSWPAALKFNDLAALAHQPRPRVHRRHRRPPDAGSLPIRKLFLIASFTQSGSSRPNPGCRKSGRSQLNREPERALVLHVGGGHRIESLSSKPYFLANFRGQGIRLLAEGASRWIRPSFAP